jgi:hypothetical protein
VMKSEVSERKSVEKNYIVCGVVVCVSVYDERCGAMGQGVGVGVGIQRHCIFAFDGGDMSE